MLLIVGRYLDSLEQDGSSQHDTLAVCFLGTLCKGFSEFPKATEVLGLLLLTLHAKDCTRSHIRTEVEVEHSMKEST